MGNLGPSGLLAGLILMLATGLLGGCSTRPVQPTTTPAAAPDAVAFLAAMTAADATQREAAWRSLAEQDETDPTVQLQRVLLSSLAGHPGYNPAGAMQQMRRLLAATAHRPAHDLLQIRLASLEATTHCWTEIHGLQQRLDSVADIERRMDKSLR